MQSMVLRRLFKRTAALLLIGAVVNIAVAWSSSVILPGAQQTSLVGWRETKKSQTGFGWEVYRYEAWSTARLIAFGRENPMPQVSQSDFGLYPFGCAWPGCLDAVVAGTTDDKGFRRLQAQMLDLRGWPMYSMQSMWHDADSTVDHTRRWRWGISLTTRVPKLSGGVNLNELRVLPLSPVWPGFLVNTLFFSAAIWLLFLAPFQVRRAIRKRRRQCASCGYPVGASSVCTECGAVLS